MRERRVAAIGLWLAGALAPVVGAQGRQLDADLQAERISVASPRPIHAAAGLGGFLGLVTAARGPRATQEVVVLQAGPLDDARLVVRDVKWPRAGGGAIERRVYDLRAEGIALLADVDERPGAETPLVPRAIYAEGWVRLVLESSRGSAVLEAQRLYLDVTTGEGSAEEAVIRLRPPPGKLLGGIAPVISAQRLRFEGPERVVATDASLSPCDYGVPHFALLADTVEFTRRRDVAEADFLGALFTQQKRPKGDGYVYPQTLRPPPASASAGSDALRREAELDRDVRVRGAALSVLGARVPVSIPLRWNTTWPLPTLRGGHSSRLGAFAIFGVRSRLTTIPLGALGELDLSGATRVEHYQRRGTGGEQGFEWTHRDAQGATQGEGFARAFGIEDRADTDRVGTPIPRQGRFWLRGLLRERLASRLQLDAEVSRQSDRGVLLEYYRSVAQTEKEQETYGHLRGWSDDFSVRALGRFRLNDFQTQVERLPEVRLDWIKTPLATDPVLGGLYLDLALRAGHLRFRPDDATGLASYRAGRGDVITQLEYKNHLGPLVFRGYGGVRESAWSERPGDDEAIDRFGAHAGWTLTTTFWRRYETPWTALRHEFLPEVGSEHRFALNRDPSELLQFDPDVEAVLPTDALVLRARTRLLGDLAGVRRKLVDLAVEARYYPRDRGADVGRQWSPIRYDLRLYLADWVAARARAEHDVNQGALVSLDATLLVRPHPSLEVEGAYRERQGGGQAVSWAARWQVTPSWFVEFAQQYDLIQDEWLYHRGRVVRSFHRFALEFTISHDPQQDDTSASVSLSLAPLSTQRGDPFERDRYRDLYR
ncbi:MAG: hypothetical protein R3F62_13140 [Planctomycetota bacterium]